MESQELKQAIIIRKDLEMGKGKMVAQGCHAAVEAALEALKKDKRLVERWIEQGQKKIVLRVDSEEELLELYRKAQELGVTAVLVVDRGLTQLAPNTVTALGLGPAPAALLDKLTGKLKLL
ncbi:MAG: peptidyl-tRNA hydrolase Pth2 [Thermofilum sp.]|jgi:PTH2 family peptidyl-tRNA hydrolase|nr:peptidyl-tRNA hydrolase Pth2 [Thermofilum sp.]